MKRSTAAIVLVALLFAQAASPLFAQQAPLPQAGGAPPITGPPIPPVQSGVQDRIDVGSVLANPLLFFLLRSDEEKNPEQAFLRADNVNFRTTVSTSGNINRAAQYQPLDTGVFLRNLFYQREYKDQIFRLFADYQGYSSSRLQAALQAPERYHLKVYQTGVFHRLQGLTDVDVNMNPSTALTRTWQRTGVEGDVAAIKGGAAVAYAGFQMDRWNANQAHSFYQLHGYNCTNCHTQGFPRNFNTQTNDWWLGGRGQLPWQSTVLDVRFRSSDYYNNGPSYTNNFGGAVGVSSLFPTSGSRDRTWTVQGYAGAGDAPWRAGVQYMGLDRANSQTSQTRNAQYLSVQATGRPIPDVALTGSYYRQNESNSYANDLSNARQRLQLQGVWAPRRELSVQGRLGLEDRQYKVYGTTAPNMQDLWFELRGDWRPTKQWHLTASFRNDNIDHPYFPTDMARKAQTNAQATYSTQDLTAGLQYNHMYGSNTVNALGSTDFIAFATARLAKRYNLSVTYDNSTIDANCAQAYFLPMPQATAAAISPGIGSPLFLQSGVPYNAHNQYVQAALTLPLGDVKRPVTVTPLYRWIQTTTQANYLQLFPTIPADSQTNITQNVYGLRVDYPVWGPSERIGLGWEHSNWKDAINSGNTGSYDLFMINFSKRF